jgi:ribonucleoside-diphosphate reductase alpha chain
MELSQRILSDITVFMKYAKYIPEKQRRETWSELVDRNKEMHLKKFPELSDEIENAYKLVYDKKILPSMRSMQFAGKPIELNPTRIYNCAYLPVDDWRAFSEIMFLLLGGTGIGFSVQHHHVEKLPEIVKPKQDRTRRWLIADNIEGWADAIKTLMKSYFYGGSKIVFDFGDIRPKGVRLITSGGKAPGPQPLKECLIKIEGILESKNNGDKLRPIEVHDIICHIADSVLAGGIRRAALISLFSANDDEMISCKSGNWWELNSQRGRANNSAVLLRHKVTEEFFFDLWKRIELSNAGEPGIYLTNDKDWGTNPCCLVGDTLITVRDENIDGSLTQSYQIPIKNLVDICQTNLIGPFVLTLNEDTNQLEWNRITDGILTKKSKTLIELEYNGKVIRCTPDHKIYTTNRGWVEAQNLDEMDELVEI